MHTLMKQLFITIILISQLCFVLKGQNLATPYKNENGKWGLIGINGNFIVKPQYSEMDVLGDGKYQVAVGGKLKEGILEGEKWGIIDSDGKFILKAEYDEIGDFINGAATITKGDKIGFINCKYKIILEPKYDFVGTMSSQGLVWVNSGGKLDERHPGLISKGKFGVINLSGDIIIPVSYSAIGYVCDTKHYHNQTKVYNAKNEIERLMLECGSQHALWAKPIELKPGSMIPADAIGLAFSNMINLTRNGIVDMDGNVLVKNGIYQRCAMPTENMSLVLTKDNRTGYHEIKSGKLITKDSIKSAFSFIGNKAIGIDSKNKWSFFDKSLSQIGECYDWISPLNGSNYLVRKDGKMSLLEAETLTPIVSDKEYIFPLKQGYIAYKESDSGLWGFLNEIGEIELSARYNYAYSFNCGVACVKSESGWGMINSALKEVIPTKFNSIVFPTTNGTDKVWVSITSERQAYKCWHIVTNDFAFESSFEKVWNFRTMGTSEYATVGIGDKYGLIDNYGKITIPIEFESKTIAEDALTYKITHGFDKWQPIHSYRFNSIQKTKHNTYTLNDTLPNEIWDF